LEDLLLDEARALPVTFALLWLDSLPFRWLIALALGVFGTLPRTESKKVLSATASFGIAGPGLFFAGATFDGGAVFA
jgi:hypothetical protein